LDRLLHSNVDEPLARVVQGELASLGKLLRDALDPEWRDAREEARRAAGDGEVGDVAEIAVEARWRRFRDGGGVRVHVGLEAVCGGLRVRSIRARSIDVVARIHRRVRLAR